MSLLKPLGQFSPFHADPSVETGVRLCSYCHALLTVMPFHGKKNNKEPIFLHNYELLTLMILSLVVMTEMQKYCITFAVAVSFR